MARDYRSHAFRRWSRRIGAVILAIAALSWLQTPHSNGLRTFLNSCLSSYDGCMCESCQQHYLPFPPRDRGACMPSWWVRNPIQPYIIGAVGIGVLLLPWIARQYGSSRPGACSRCGFDLNGLTAGHCPDCGWSIVRAAEEPIRDPAILRPWDESSSG